jgi:hypothetical protein
MAMLLDGLSSGKAMATLGAPLASPAGEPLIDEAANRDRRGSQPEDGVRVAGHAATGKSLQMAVGVAEGVAFGRFNFAAAFGTGEIEHDAIPSITGWIAGRGRGAAKFVFKEEND